MSEPVTQQMVDMFVNAVVDTTADCGWDYSENGEAGSAVR
jgi:hypothetical protein